jgi:ATP-dependent DNA helicase RecQ
MRQFQAGYILDGLQDVFEKKTPKQFAFKELTNWCSYFTFESRSKFENTEIEYPSRIAILINLLQRGAPTKLNKYALDFIIEKSGFLKYDSENDSSIIVQFNQLTADTKDLIFRSLHLIEPRLDIQTQKQNYEQSWENLGSNYEENFVFEGLPYALGENGVAFIQLLATQRTISSIAKDIKELQKVQTRVKNNFDQQRTDFSIQFPYASIEGSKGIVIEIDGFQHGSPDQIFLDTERDKIVAESGWHNTLRIKTSEFGSQQFVNKIRNILVPAVDNDFVFNCINNFVKPIWETENGKNIIQICLIPFAVARLQRAILEAIAKGILDLNEKKWTIAILERDVPCAQLAIDDLIKTTEVFSSLSEDPFILPKIELSIFSTQEFINSNYHVSSIELISEFNSTKHFDLVIDISVLERFNNCGNIASNATEVITIRSIHYKDTKRKTATTELIKYRPFCVNHNESGVWNIEDLRIKESLEYLLQCLFRKRSFREGQLPIMHNALQCKSVIGLLPTGGGKSLTYQLSALLQPGICLVIDPIRSLMKDQVDGLIKNQIDSCVYINSTLQGEEKRIAMRKLATGEVQFVFISPERLQMEEFRNLLNDMYDEGLYFSYCIIDEAHCVSEWGHDFRTAYLRLGENAIRYCKTKNQNYIPLFGLTATASYDVLADVQRELSGNDEKRRLTEDSIIRSEYSKRNELQYVIEEVTYPTGALNNIWDLKRELSGKKQARVKRLLTDLPVTINSFLSDPNSVFSESDWELNEKGEQEIFKKIQIENYSTDEFYLNNKNAALIFCPHTKGSFGVTDKFKIDRSGMPAVREGYYDILVSQPKIIAGYFMGSGNDSDTIGKTIQEESFENQDKFINSELNLMVATKAFGMGIDKENIRCTIHINYPGSIESYVQEAGRAGRDRKMALSFILFNDQEVDLPTEDELVDHDLDINMYFHKNSFKGVAKELAVLDELLTEIYFPDRTFELENLINNEFDINVKCNYWEGGINKRLYINFNFSEPLGYLDLNSLNGFPGGSVNPVLSAQIFPLLKEYIQSLNLNEAVYLWLQRSDKQIGIEKIIQSKREGDDFNITVGFYNNTKERVKTITEWLKKVVHSSFTEQIVQRMRANCTEAESFIEEVCDNYGRFTQGQELDFETFCNNRDKSKGNPVGTAYKMFMALYNGYRDKMDTEKAIYRLSTLGIIDDYTVNFSSNTFTLKGVKKTANDYRKNLHGYLLKYYSEKTTEAKLRKLDRIDEPTPIRKALFFLVNFVYSEIQKKRQLAIHDMKTACRLGLEKGSVELKDYIDLYFNSKYARAGYLYFNEKGKEVNASLPDLTDNGKNEDLKWVWLFIEIVEEDPKAGQIDNIKHLRGACTRMLNNQPDSYTLLMLNAFTLYMLEYKNPRYLQEAENLLLNAFSSIQEKESNWSDKKLESVYEEFTEKLIDKNGELNYFMELYGFSFDFDSIMIKRLLDPLQKANSTLRNLNKILS